MTIKLTDRWGDTINIRYFVLEPTQRGTIMGADYERPNVAVPYSKAVGKPLGILLVDVINIDTIRGLHWNNNQRQLGSKVNILEKGEIMLKLAKGLRLPYGQPIYVDNGKGVLTWKKLGKEVGYLSNKQDSDGWCPVTVDFTKE